MRNYRLHFLLQRLDLVLNRGFLVCLGHLAQVLDLFLDLALELAYNLLALLFNFRFHILHFPLLLFVLLCCLLRLFLCDAAHVVDDLDLRVAHHRLGAAGRLVGRGHFSEMHDTSLFAFVDDQLRNGAEVFEIRPNFSQQEPRWLYILHEYGVAPLVQLGFSLQSRFSDRIALGLHFGIDRLLLLLHQTFLNGFCVLPIRRHLLHQHLGCHRAQLRGGQTQRALLELCDLNLLHLLLLNLPKVEKLLSLFRDELL